MRRVALETFLILVLAGGLTWVFNVQRVMAQSGTVCINADGSVTPSAAPISTTDNITYTLTGNIPSDGDGLVILRSNIIVNGDGYVIQGSGPTAFAPGLPMLPSMGINLTGASNVTIEHTRITTFTYGLWLVSSGNTVSENLVLNNYIGMGLSSSPGNTLVGNNIMTNNWDGIDFDSSSGNSISGNNISLNYNNGVWLGSSSDDNTISGNSFGGNNIANGGGIAISSSSRNNVSNNTVTGGIWLEDASRNSVSNNTIVGDIELDSSSNNTVYENVFFGGGLTVSDSYGNVEGNVVNGKPLVYFEGASNLVVRDAGQVVLVECNNITVSDLNLSYTSVGVELWRTNSSTITNNNMANDNRTGIELSFSSGNRVNGNTIVNSGGGISFRSSSSNIVSGDNITGNGDGVKLDACNDNSISDNNVANNGGGITLEASSGNNVSGNSITASDSYGVWLESSFDNRFIGNNVANNAGGIAIEGSGDNSFIGNNVTANNLFYGLWISSSLNNHLYHNNFINNPNQTSIYVSEPNDLDNGYPSSGNYWSDYKGTDSNGDGIGDTPYVVDANNRDRYPLMAPYSVFYAGTWNGTACSVGVMSNSTFSDFQVDVAQKTIGFNVTDAEGSAGFCRVTISNVIVQNLWQGNYTVLVDGEPWPFSNWTDATNTYVYFNYTHSQLQIVIIPELPSPLTLSMLMIVTLLATIASRKKWPKHQLF